MGGHGETQCLGQFFHCRALNLRQDAFQAVPPGIRDALQVKIHHPGTELINLCVIPLGCLRERLIIFGLCDGPIRKLQVQIGKPQSQGILILFGHGFCICLEFLLQSVEAIHIQGRATVLNL